MEPRRSPTPEAITIASTNASRADRRQSLGTGSMMAALPAPWVQAVFDEIDCGLLVCTATGQVVCRNQSARRALRGEHPLMLDSHGVLEARDPRHGPLWAQALHSVASQARRQFLQLDPMLTDKCIALVPLPGGEAPVLPAVLILLGRQQLCGKLAAQWFGMSHGLSPTEDNVLGALAAGHRPQHIAQLHGVCVSTVRTQVASINNKAQTHATGDLLRRLALLPPMVGALRQCLD